MKQYKVLQANMIQDDYEWHLHADGCKDLFHSKYFFDDLNFTITAESSDEALASWIDSEMQEMGWTHDHVKVMGCAR